jgi:starvation-inducible DNA-binding protein
MDSVSDSALETPPIRRRRADPESCEAINPLESLLDESIRLRDLYRHARRRTCESPFVQLRTMFNAHCNEQVRLIDLLVDRVRISGGASRIFAGTFLQAPQPSWDPRSRNARNLILRTLLDAHELILSIAQLWGDEKSGHAWIRDFAVGQVVLANEQQRLSICDLLGNRREEFLTSIPYQWTPD